MSSALLLLASVFVSTEPVSGAGVIEDGFKVVNALLRFPFEATNAILGDLKQNLAGRIALPENDQHLTPTYPQPYGNAPYYHQQHPNQQNSIYQNYPNQHLPILHPTQMNINWQYPSQQYSNSNNPTVQNPNPQYPNQNIQNWQYPIQQYPNQNYPNPTNSNHNNPNSQYSNQNKPNPQYPNHNIPPPQYPNQYNPHPQYPKQDNSNPQNPNKNNPNSQYPNQYNPNSQFPNQKNPNLQYPNINLNGQFSIPHHTSPNPQTKPYPNPNPHPINSTPINILNVSDIEKREYLQEQFASSETAINRLVQFVEEKCITREGCGEVILGLRAYLSYVDVLYYMISTKYLREDMGNVEYVWKNMLEMMEHMKNKDALFVLDADSLVEFNNNLELVENAVAKSIVAVYPNFSKYPKNPPQTTIFS